MNQKKTKKDQRKDYDKLKVTAESLFVNLGMTAKEIHESLDISEVTLSRWRNAENWDEKRQFLRITPTRLRETLLREAEKVANGEESIVNADKVAKLLAGADKLAAKATPDVAYSVLTDCCQYIATINADFAAKMAEHHKLYLQHKMEQEG